MNDNKVARSNEISKKTIAALVALGMIIAFPLTISDKAAFAIGTNSTTSGTAGASVTKLTTTSSPVVLPLFKALYDSKGVLFIITEVSDKTMKDQIGNFTGSPVNYEPNLTKSQDIGQLWIFKNGVKGPGFMGFQTNVLNSIPGDPHYRR